MDAIYIYIYIFCFVCGVDNDKINYTWTKGGGILIDAKI